MSDLFPVTHLTERDNALYLEEIALNDIAREFECDGWESQIIPSDTTTQISKAQQYCTLLIIWIKAF